MTKMDKRTPDIRIHHAGISVYDMEESVAWYKKNLGFKVVKDQGFVPGIQAKIMFMEKDGFRIELFEYMDPKKLPEERWTPNSDLQTVGTKHIAFETDDMDALKAAFIDNGVDIAEEIRMDGDAVVFMRDCNGVLIEIIQQSDGEGV